MPLSTQTQKHPVGISLFGLVPVFFIALLLSWLTFIEINAYDAVILAKVANPMAKFIGPVFFASTILTGVLMGLAVPLLSRGHIAFAAGLAMGKMASIPHGLRPLDVLIVALMTGLVYLASVGMVVVSRVPKPRT